MLHVITKAMKILTSMMEENFTVYSEEYNLRMV